MLHSNDARSRFVTSPPILDDLLFYELVRLRVLSVVTLPHRRFFGLATQEVGPLLRTSIRTQKVSLPHCSSIPSQVYYPFNPSFSSRPQPTLRRQLSFNYTLTDLSPFSSFLSMNPFPIDGPARPATTPVTPSQFNPPQQAAVPVRPGLTYPSSHQPVAPTRPLPRIRSASMLIPAVRPGPPGWRGSGAGAGPSRVSPYNATNVAHAARQAAEARRAREFDSDFLVYPIPPQSLPPGPAPVGVNPNGSNNPAAATAVASPARLPQPQNLPAQPRTMTEAEARQIENTAQLEKSLATIAEIGQRVKEYCDLNSAAGFQFAPPPRH